jgi:cytochrome P450
MTLLVAGNETTRNLISGGALALADHPDQRAWLADDHERIPNAVDEMLRWVSPTRSFVRYAVTDSTLGGTAIEAGQHVVMFYGSANRDEQVFGETADRFDVAREDAHRHLAFGFGEHLCLGAHLARLEAAADWVRRSRKHLPSSKAASSSPRATRLNSRRQPTRWRTKTRRFLRCRQISHAEIMCEAWEKR